MLSASGVACANAGDGEQHKQQDMDRLHQQLRRGARPDRQPTIVAAAHANAVGCGIALLDRDRLARFQVVVLDEAQEVLVLIDDARHGDRSVERTRQQRLELLRLDQAFGVGNRIAVRIGLRPAQHGVHAIDKAIADGVFELLGLVVHFVPRVAHHLDQEELDQSMTTGDESGEFLPGLGQCHPGVGLVLDQPRLRERLDHRRCRAGRDVESRRQLTHRQQPLWRVQAVSCRCRWL